ncbi:MAG TPA: ATP-binding cassette domain-containing protein, partial [Candidatus Competibacter sp.]|nr:ATP-binding cassette domain-containing protein [Candidatus Competibacter sp.]
MPSEISSAPAPPAAGGDRLLEVIGLSSQYGPVRAIHQIDLSVSAGELVAIVGGNGAGKT